MRNIIPLPSLKVFFLAPGILLLSTPLPRARMRAHTWDRCATMRGFLSRNVNHFRYSILNSVREKTRTIMVSEGPVAVAATWCHCWNTGWPATLMPSPLSPKIGLELPNLNISSLNDLLTWKSDAIPGCCLASLLHSDFFLMSWVTIIHYTYICDTQALELPASGVQI